MRIFQSLGAEIGRKSPRKIGLRCSRRSARFGPDRAPAEQCINLPAR